MDQFHDALTAIRRIFRVIEIHSTALREATHLKVSQLMVLQALEDTQELTIGEIARRIYMAQASVTALVSRLEQMGFVSRTRSADDKRKVMVRITAAGHDILEQAPSGLQQRLAAQFSPLEPWEKSMLVASLQRVATMLETPCDQADRHIAPDDNLDPVDPAVLP